MKLVIVSFLIGLVLASAGVATLAFFKASRLIDQGHREWELRAIVVADRDVPAGQPLTIEDLAQRSVPASFVTSSMVAPHEASAVVQHPSNVPLHKGDALHWTMFVDYTASDACFRAIVAKVNAAGESARAGAISRFAERLGASLPEPEPVLAPASDASGSVAVVVLKAEVPEGKVIEESMLAVGKLPRALATASFVPAERLRDVVGVRTLVPLQPKDALMWQMLDDAERPRRAASCMAVSGAAMNEARERATREESAEFARGQEAH